MHDLDCIQRIDVPLRVLDETWRALRHFGNHGHEGFVLWLGDISAEGARVAIALVPPQESIRSEDGVGYFVSSDTLFQLNLELHRSGLRLLAQVHSHPGAAYHSQTDDAYAVVTTEGGFSIVVPDFGAAPAELADCAVYRLRRGTWCALSRIEIEHILVVHAY